MVVSLARTFEQVKLAREVTLLTSNDEKIAEDYEPGDGKGGKKIRHEQYSRYITAKAS